MRFLFSLAWYAAIIYGAKRVYSHSLAARHAVAPLEKARHAASALFVCGQVLWMYAVLDDARRDINFSSGRFQVMAVLGVLGGSIIWAVVLMGPTWLPRRLLSGNPGPTRCGFAAFIARGVAVFAGAVICIAPIIFSFANSFGEWIEAILTVAIPMLILIYAALETGKLSARASSGG